MKRILLLSAIGLSVLTGCSTAYKAGQTPDDVYYSPAKGVSEKKEDKKQAQQQQERYDEYTNNADDRYLRMKVANRGRWSSIDDYSYWYDSRYDFCPTNTSFYNSPYAVNPWSIGYSIGYGRPYYGSIYGGWNSPVYTVAIYSTPKFSGGYTSGSNISAYRNKNYNNQNAGYTGKNGQFIPAASNSNSFGNLLKRVFTPATSSSSSSSYDRAARTYTPTNNNSTPTPTPATSSSAGGNSGGFKSTGSSSSSGRGGRG